MEIKPLFSAIVQSLNPYAYEHLTEKKFAMAMRYFCFLLFLTLIVMFILLIPALFSIPKDIQASTANFDTLSLNLDMSFQKPFVLMSDPLIVADKNTSMNGATFLISDNAIYYKSFLIFGAAKSIPINKNIDLKTDPNLERDIGIKLLFLGPSLFFWSFVVFAIYFWIIIFITFIIGILLLGILRFPVRALRMFKIAVYSSTIMILVELLAMPFYRLFYLPIIIYWILFLIIILTVRDSETPKGRTESVYASGSKKDIFNDSGKSKYAGSSQNSLPKKDSYEVDERGNLQGTSKRKRSFDEENDGFVMLK